MDGTNTDKVKNSMLRWYSCLMDKKYLGGVRVGGGYDLKFSPDNCIGEWDFTIGGLKERLRMVVTSTILKKQSQEYSTSKEQYPPYYHNHVYSFVQHLLIT